VTTAPRSTSTIACVTRDKAIDRVRKLRGVTVDRGATQQEAATAAALAARLSTRFGLDRPVAIGSQVARYATSAKADSRSPRSLRFVALA
jgi:predicted Zn-dependent peptidase